MKYLKRIILENRDKDLTPQEQASLDAGTNRIRDRYNRLRAMVSGRYGGGPVGFRRKTDLDVRQQKEDERNFARFEKKEDRVIPLTLSMISEKKLLHVNQQDGEEAVDDLVRTPGKAAPKTPQSARSRDAALAAAEKPKSRKPPKKGDTAQQTLVRQDMFDLARHRRKNAEGWDEEATGRPTPYPSTSKKPGRERGEPTKLSRREAAGLPRREGVDDSVIPLTLPMIAEGKAARDRQDAILRKLHTTGQKDSAAAEYIRSRKASRGAGQSLAREIASKGPGTQPSDADTSRGKAAAKPRKEIAAGTWKGRERPFDLGRTVPKSEADKWEDEDRDYT